MVSMTFLENQNEIMLPSLPAEPRNNIPLNSIIALRILSSETDTGGSLLSNSENQMKLTIEFNEEVTKAVRSF